MKKIVLFLLTFSICTGLLAQKTKKENKKADQKTEKKTDQKSEARNKILGGKTKSQKKEDAVIWEGTNDKDGGGPKPSKNQPAKVRDAFKADYPNARNVRWSKYRGDWTATFSNGLITSTAIYHANGQRKDTRTAIQREQLPKVIDDILKRRPNTELGNIVKIEFPQGLKDVFRIRTTENNTTRFSFFDANGQEVKYDY